MPFVRLRSGSLQPFGIRELDFACHAYPGHHLDEDPTAVELPPGQPVAGGGGEGMVVVVPAFAQCQDTDYWVVAAVVMAFIGLTSPDVADRVDAPGDVMLKEDPHQAAPEESCEGSEPCSTDDAAEDRWNDEAQQNPEREQIADQSQILVRFEIGNVSILIRLFDLEEPTKMGVDEPLDSSSIPDMR